MKQFDTSDRVINHYEPASVRRTIFGVIASLLSMGLPIGLTEIIRPGGDRVIGVGGLVFAAIAAVLAFLSFRGTLKE